MGLLFELELMHDIGDIICKSQQIEIRCGHQTETCNELCVLEEEPKMMGSQKPVRTIRIVVLAVTMLRAKLCMNIRYDGERAAYKNQNTDVTTICDKVLAVPTEKCNNTVAKAARIYPLWLKNCYKYPFFTSNGALFKHDDLLLHL